MLLMRAKIFSRNEGGKAMSEVLQAEGEKRPVYRRARTAQVILFAMNALMSMGIYSLVGLASYSANIGYGIATLTVGYILTFTRIFDAITDPLMAFVYDRVNTRYGKIRVLVICGWCIEAFALLFLFNFASSKGHGILIFILLYMLYVVGYTCVNMTVQTIPALLSNDPKQRPMIGVWQAAFQYVVPMALMVVLNVVLLPRFGGKYNQAFLAAACYVCLAVTFLGMVAVCLSVRKIDIPENFAGLTEKREKLKLRDMAEVLAHNNPLKCYIAAAASDKIAQQTSSQAIVSTLMFGIVIGNMSMSTMLGVVSMLPSIIFGFFGAKYAGKHGNKEATVTWTKICLAVTALMIVFLALSDTRRIAVMMSIPMILYLALDLLGNGSKMCVTMANTAFMADIIDYELNRSGKYIPAVVTGTYSLIDKIVSSFSAAIAAGGVAVIGYTTAMPQPGDKLTSSVLWMCIILRYGLSMLGWVCTLIAMHFCKLDKASMVQIQKDIADKRAALAKRNAVGAAGRN